MSSLYPPETQSNSAPYLNDHPSPRCAKRMEEDSDRAVWTIPKQAETKLLRSVGKWLSRWEKIREISWGSKGEYMYIIYIYIYILYYIKLRNNNYITMSDLRYYMYTYIYIWLVLKPRCLKQSSLLYGFLTWKQWDVTGGDFTLGYQEGRKYGWQFFAG